VLDPDEQMLETARGAWQLHADRVPGSVAFRQGLGEQAAELVGDGWDAVLCHGVLMYVDDPDTLLGAVAQCVRPGGVVSVLAKQAGALAMRRGLERDWGGVLEVLHSPVEAGNLGTISRGVDREDVVRVLAEHHVALRQWYGVRVFTDHLGEEPVGDDFDQVLQAEWAAGCLDPYRRIARLFHLLAAAKIGEGRPGR